ncbi:MAG: alpha/beta fold hydrolase [Solirubrobacterales bacterium]|nr:alpha/beta hydrolase [Solirubrobacterales bacterium]
MAERFCDVGRGVTLCYEPFGDSGDAPILLVMGLATQMIAWHEDFCEALADRGFYVVRYDNRDSGRSTHFDFPPPTLRQLMRRRPSPAQYTLSDMAQDAADLMRGLGIAPAHVVGASMGGMIAQLLAVEHPDVVRSLTSLMSTTGSRRHGQPALSVYPYLLSRPPHDRDGYVRRSAEIFGLIGSTGFPRDEQMIRERAARSFDRGYDVRAGGRQLGAIVASGNRERALSRITAPTLVVHGTVDKMIRPSGGRATAKAIPGARLMMIEGMGHDLPRAAWPQLIDAIAEHARAADGLRGRAEAAIRPGN